MLRTDTNKLIFDILGLSEMLYHIPSFKCLITSCSTLNGGVKLHEEETFNAKTFVNFSVMYELSKTMFVSFTIGKVNFVIRKLHRLPNSKNDVFVSEIYKIVNTNK